MSLFQRFKAWIAGEPMPPADEPELAPSEPTPGVSNERPSSYREPAHAVAQAPPRPDGPARARRSRPRRRGSSSDDSDVERAARALADRGSLEEALALLAARPMLAKHDSRARLPCLCRRCVGATPSTTGVDGVGFTRDFVVSERRVLFYWMPSELGPIQRRVRVSMRVTISQRVRSAGPRMIDLDAPPVPPRIAINPFTKERVIVPAPETRRPKNPFTGRPVA